MLTRSKIINVDLDGVVYPFNTMLASWLEISGRYGPLDLWAVGVVGGSWPTPTTWDYWDEWEMSVGEWNTQFRRGVERDYIWSEGEPLPGAVDGLWQLSDAGFYIRIVTHRLNHKFGHKKAIDSTVEWLDRYAIPYRSIAFLGSEEKNNYAAQWLVDDNKRNAESFCITDVCWGILMDQPYNQGETPALRAYSWADVVAYVKEGEELGD